MKSKNIILLIVVTAIIAIVFYSFQGSQDDEAYFEQIQKERKEKDHFMRTAKESPITDKENFKGLNYFKADIRFKIIADLTPITERKAVILATNDGKEERYLEYAYASFTLDGKENKLLILEIMDMGPFRGKLFLAFGDETSAVETYGAGRYLDINKTPGATTITLDFNKAYNPYCAYNHTFSCPLPPRENLLTVAIRAGEKNYE
ncbi:MAG TPA: DUF1684 domain-containing protein [Chryseosolibacter sp.]|nr:DUF1684 domain-containing protein [Chryseosolibacter sp.]